MGSMADQRMLCKSKVHRSRLYQYYSALVQWIADRVARVRSAGNETIFDLHDLHARTRSNELSPSGIELEIATNRQHHGYSFQ